MSDPQDRAPSLAQVTWARTVSIVGILFFLSMIILMVSTGAFIAAQNHLLSLPLWVWTWLEFAIVPMVVILWFQWLSVVGSYLLRLPHKEWYGGIFAASCGVLLLVIHLPERGAVWGLPILCVTYVAQWVLDAQLPSTGRRKGGRRGSLRKRTKVSRRTRSNTAKRPSIPLQDYVVMHREQGNFSSFTKDISYRQDTIASKQNVVLWSSRTDEKYAVGLHKHLCLKERRGFIELWDMTRVKPGDQWQDQKRLAIQSAAVIILFASADFLKDELPMFRDVFNHAQREAAILVVYANFCDLSDSELGDYYPVNVKDRPLALLKPAERERIFDKTAQGICKQLHSFYKMAQ